MIRVKRCSCHRIRDETLSKNLYIAKQKHISFCFCGFNHHREMLWIISASFPVTPIRCNCPVITFFPYVLILPLLCWFHLLYLQISSGDFVFSHPTLSSYSSASSFWSLSFLSLHWSKKYSLFPLLQNSFILLQPCDYVVKAFFPLLKGR